MKRLRHMVKIGPSAKEIRCVGANAEVTFAPMEAIADGIGGLDTSTLKALKEVRSGSYNYFADGDLLLAKVTPCFENGKKAVATNLANGIGFATSEVYVIRPDTSKISRQYLYYILCSEDYRAEGMRSMVGAGGLKRVSDQSILDYRPAIADLDTQEQVALAIARETARIDALIEKKTRFIELLKEKRQALVTHAVTKGLDANAPMKDSGVQWIGEVPAHWNETRLRFIVKERGGKTPSKDNGRFWDGNIPWVSPKDMKVDVLESSIDKITELAVQQCGMTMLEARTVLIVVRGMILAHSFPVAETSVPVTINQDMKALTPREDVEATFLRLLLQSLKQVVVDILVAEAAHGTRVLRTDIWKQLPVFLPPQSEQKAIIQRIEGDARKIDMLVKASMRSIQLLKERRSALVTAAVTGQIDLREDAT